MHNRLAREYRRALFLFIVLFSAILVGGLLYPFHLADEARLQRNIDRRVEKNRSFYDLLLSRKDEQVAALGSRTQIRLLLVLFADGEASLDELRTFTQPRYGDGLSVYSDVLGAARFDAKGDLVARQGMPLPYRELQAGDKLVEPREANGSDPAAPRALEIRHPIIESGRVIGQDAVLFDISAAVVEEDGIAYRLIDRREPLPDDSKGAWQIVDTSVPHIALAYRFSENFARPRLSDSLVRALPFAFSLLALVVLGAYFSIYRASRSIIASYAALSERRALLVRETNHRVKNNLNIVAGIVASHIMENGPTPALEDIESRIMLVGLIHDQLYRCEDAEEVSLKPYLTELGQAIFAAHSATETYRLDVSGADIATTGEACLGVGLIVSELIINALKYALAPGDGISVVLTSGADGWGLDFRNGGRVFPPEIDPLSSDGFGMELIRMYAKQLGGTLRFERLPATRFAFAFPFRAVRRSKARSAAAV